MGVHRTATIVSFVLAQAAWSMPALAGAFATARYSAEHGNPTTENASSIYFNPGAMTRGDRTRGLLDANLAFRRVTYFHTLKEGGPGEPDDAPDDARDANAGRATAFNVFGAPTLGLIAKAGDKLAIGGLIHGPFGGMVQFDERDAYRNHPAYAGPVDGPQRWHVITGATASIYISAGAAYEFTKAFSLGVAFNLIRTSVETLRAKGPGTTNNLATEGRAALSVSGWQWSFAAGILSEAIEDQLWLGLSYQAQPNVSGGMVLEGTQRTAFAGAVSERDANLHQTYPDIVRLGLAYRPQPLLELRLFGDYQRWSVLEDQCVTVAGRNCTLAADGSTVSGTNSEVLVNARRDWQDTAGVRAGASFWTKEDRALELFGGLGWDGNAVPDATLEASVPDSNKLHVAAGARFALGKSMHLAASYTHLHYIGRDNAGKSRLSELQGPSNAPDGGGVYNSWVGIVNANVEVAF